MNYVTFDIETYSPSNSQKINTSEFRVSVIGAYFSWSDSYIAFLEDDVSVFLNILKQAELVVGFNHIWFDLAVLQKYCSYNLLDLPNYDIMVEAEKKLGFKTKLNDLCKANLGKFKTDSYDNFKHYYNDKNWFPLIDYCMNDVKLTEELFKLIRQNNCLSYNDLLDIKKIIFDKPVPGKMINSVSIESIF